MSETPFTPPEFRQSAFHCPTCNAYANHLWSDGYAKYGSGGFSGIAGICFSWCTHCHNEGIWVGERLVYPESSQAPLPNADLPDEIRADYLEASSIIGRSPRGSAALLRLCIQKLCGDLGESGKNISKDISELVKKGLNPKIQKRGQTGSGLPF